MLRTVLAIVCLMSLTACGLKGPLYLPERAPQPASPMATPVPTSPFAEDGAQGESDAQLLSRALLLAEERIKERDRHISRLKEENALSALKLERQAPKVRYFDEVLRSKSTYTATQIAKELGMSGRELNNRLRMLGVQFRQSGTWLLTAPYQKEGFTLTHTHLWQSRDGESGTAMHTVWTERGRLFIHRILGGGAG